MDKSTESLSDSDSSTSSSWVFVEDNNALDPSANTFYLNCSKEPIQELTEQELGTVVSDIESDTDGISVISENEENNYLDTITASTTFKGSNTEIPTDSAHKDDETRKPTIESLSSELKQLNTENDKTNSIQFKKFCSPAYLVGAGLVLTAILFAPYCNVETKLDTTKEKYQLGEKLNIVSNGDNIDGSDLVFYKDGTVEECNCKTEHLSIGSDITADSEAHAYHHKKCIGKNKCNKRKGAMDKHHSKDDKHIVQVKHQTQEENLHSHDELREVNFKFNNKDYKSFQPKKNNYKKTKDNSFISDSDQSKLRNKKVRKFIGQNIKKNKTQTFDKSKKSYQDKENFEKKQKINKKGHGKNDKNKYDLPKFEKPKIQYHDDENALNEEQIFHVKEKKLKVKEDYLNKKEEFLIYKEYDLRQRELKLQKAKGGQINKKKSEFIHKESEWETMCLKDSRENQHECKKHLNKVIDGNIKLKVKFNNSAKYNRLNYGKSFKHLKKINDTVLNDWYSNLHSARNQFRKQEHASDWLFDRAKMRSKRRDKAEWYFQWMTDREHFRIRRNYRPYTS